MIKISKNVMVSILTLLLTLIALSTTTFAWFTLSKTATISNITANVQAGEGLEVALGIGSFKTSYRNNLRNDDWDELMLQTEFNDFELNAVSTDNLIDFYRLAFKNQDDLDPTITNPGLYKDIAVSNVDYLEFIVHFKSNSEGTVRFKDYLFIDNEIEFTPSVSHTVGNPLGGTTNSPTSFNAYASNAARIAVGNTVVQNDNNNGANTHMTNKGVSYGQFSYLTEMGNKIYWEGNQLALTDSSITGIDIHEALTSIANPIVIGPLVFNASLNAYVSSVSIKIWIEGFDADAYDSIFGAKLELALSFTKE